MGKKSKTDSAKKSKISVLGWFLIVAGAILLAIAARYIYVMFINPMSAFDTPPIVSAPPTELPPVSTDSNAPLPTPTPTLSPEELLERQADLKFMENRVNILILGWDQSPEREDADSELYRDEENNYRSDVMMLMTVDFATSEVSLISIPRDTYAPIYNTSGRWKINASFAHGGSAEGDGFTYAMNTVGELLGVPIDYYAGVDMIGLKNVVDAMGGLYYDVDMRIELNGRVLEEGYQLLDGQQTLDYCRDRKGITGTNSDNMNSDIGRADRQQRVLFALFEQLQSTDQLVNFPRIYASVEDDIHTNLNSEQIAALAVFALELDMEDLNRYTLEGAYVNDVYNASFYVLENDSLVALVEEVFGITIEPNPRYDLDYVRADKAAEDALSYAQGAEYLLGVVSMPASSAVSTGYLPPEVQKVHAAINSLYTAAANSAALAEAQSSTLPDITNDDPNTTTPESGTDEDQSAAVTSESVAEGAEPFLPLHFDEVDNAAAVLNQAMYELCIRYGISKANVSAGALPSAFYESLPNYQTAARPSEGLHVVADPQYVIP